MYVATLLIDGRIPRPTTDSLELNNIWYAIHVFQLISKIPIIKAPFGKEVVGKEKKSKIPKCRHGILKRCIIDEDNNTEYVCLYSNEKYNCPDILDGNIDFTNFWKDIIELFDENKQLFNNCDESLDNDDLDTNTKTEFNKHRRDGIIWLNLAEIKIKQASELYFNNRIKSANKK